MDSRTTLATRLEAGSFNFITPAQHEPVITHRKKLSQSGALNSSLTLPSPATPPVGDIRPVFDLPRELLIKILGYGDLHDTTSSMLTCKAFAEPARCALWTRCGTRGLSRLRSMPDEDRQHYLQNIQHLDVGLDPELKETGSAVLYPTNYQMVAQSSLLPTQPVAQIIPPHLKSFTALLESYRGRRTVDNIIPALARARGLRELRITYHVEGLMPEAVSRLLNNLIHLETFEVNYIGSKLLFPELAIHPTIRDITLGDGIDIRLVRRTLAVPQPFNQLVSLDLIIDSDAAAELFPRIPQLERLGARIRTTRNLSNDQDEHALHACMEAIGALSNLTLLNIRFVYYDLSEDIKPLRKLTKVRQLRLFPHPHDESIDEPGEYVDELLEGVQNMPLVELRLDIEFDATEWLKRVGRTFRSLQVLEVKCADCDFQYLDIDMPPVFPALERLHIGAARGDRDNMGKCTKTWASKLMIAAPSLHQFKTRSNFVMEFYKQGGARKWTAYYKGRSRMGKTIILQDFNSHKGMGGKKNQKK